MTLDALYCHLAELLFLVGMIPAWFAGCGIGEWLELRFKLLRRLRGW